MSYSKATDQKWQQKWKETNLYKYDENANDWKFEDIADYDPNNSAFILPVTRNVFMKYYSPQTTNFSTWDQHDFEGYKDDIRKVIGEFLTNKPSNK